MTTEADNLEINSLEAAFAEAETEQQTEEESAEKTATEEAPQEEASTESSEEQEEASLEDEAPKGEELSEGNPYKEEYQERMKGYQRAYTKKVQQMQSESEKQIQSLREEYDQKLQLALSKFGSQQEPKENSESKEDNSIDTLFEGADPKSVEVFKTAVERIAGKAVESATASLKKENEELKGYVNSQQQMTSQQQKISAALEAVPELKESTIQHELATWAEANPEKVRGLSIEDMYWKWNGTTGRFKDLAKREAKKEFDRKEKKQLESGGVSNIVEDEEILDLADAFSKATREAKLQEKK